MNPIELTLSEVKTIKNETLKISSAFDESVRLFLERFKGQDCLNDDMAEDDVSMEFKEAFFKLIDARNCVAESLALMGDFCRSIEFVKGQEVKYGDSGQIIRTVNLHDFLMENIAVGSDSQWYLMFENPPKEIPNMICYMNGRVYYRTSVKDVRNHYLVTLGESKNFSDNDFFPEGCWAEMNAVAIITQNDMTVAVVR